MVLVQALFSALIFLPVGSDMVSVGLNALPELFVGGCGQAQRKGAFCVM